MPTTAHHAHIASSSSTVFPSSHRRPFAWPSSSQLVYTQATRSHRPSAFQRDTNPDLPVHRGETRLRQAARGSPAPFLVVSVLLALLLAALCKPIALRLWLEPAVETRTHLRNTINAHRQTPHRYCHHQQHTATLVAHAPRLIPLTGLLDTLVTYRSAVSTTLHTRLFTAVATRRRWKSGELRTRRHRKTQETLCYRQEAALDGLTPADHFSFDKTHSFTTLRWSMHR